MNKKVHTVAIGQLNCLSVGLAVLTLISARAMLIPSLLVQALSNRKYHHLYQHLLVDVR